MTNLSLNDVPESFRAFAEPLLGRADAGFRLVRLLGTLESKVPKAEAEAMALLLRTRLPWSAEMASITGTILKDRFPTWYVSAVNDAARNQTYATALGNAIKRGMIVVETGTGSGLFAMMAIRAGAEHVYTIERDPFVAALAREVIDLNEMSECITVLEQDARTVEAGREIPGPGDLLLHEFSSEDFVIADLQTLMDGFQANLVRPGAPVLPTVFFAMGQLVGDPGLADQARVNGPIEGFDLGPLNSLATDRVALAPGQKVADQLSAPVQLARHDVTLGQLVAEGPHCISVAATQTGTAQGVVQWIAQEFPCGTRYENAPGQAAYWAPYFRAFPDPIAVRTGDVVELKVTAAPSGLYVDVDLAAA